MVDGNSPLYFPFPQLYCVRFDRVSFCELYDAGRAGGAVKILLLHKMGQRLYQVQKGSNT
jgi:hypothetical protein